MRTEIELNSICISGVPCGNCGSSMEWVVDLGDVRASEEIPLDFECDKCGHTTLKIFKVTLEDAE
jgi:transcription elongation factor Elf1